MRKTRHWRETFNPAMDFVFRKRLSGFVPGDSIPEGMPINKRRWLWKSRYICERRFCEDENVPKPEIQVERKDRGWITVTMPSGERKSLRGEAALEEFLRQKEAA